MRTIAEINDKIVQGKVVAWTVEELKAKVADIGISQAFKQVDVICTGTFEPMESSGAIINLGHTDPPIKIRQCWLDGVPAYAGFGAVDIYLGATAMAESSVNETNELRSLNKVNLNRGGGHVIENLIAGKSVAFKAIGQGTDCYPRINFDARCDNKW